MSDTEIFGEMPSKALCTCARRNSGSASVDMSLKGLWGDGMMTTESTSGRDAA